MSSADPVHQILRTRLSTERLAPYEARMGDLSGAIALYEWNMAISSAMFETLGAYEVLLRNAMHDRLTRYFSRRHRTSDPWYRWADLGDGAQLDIDKAVRRATMNGKLPEVPGKVVAELSFGFWFFLLSSRYQATLWPAVKPAFAGHPAGPKVPPGEVRRRVERLHIVRNRVAHHEPMFKRDIRQDFDLTADAASWICPDTAGWMRLRSRVLAVLASRPAQFESN